MFKPTVDAAVDAASVLFSLPEYRVVTLVRGVEGAREVFVDTPVLEAGCPVATRVHQRTTQRLRDVPFDGLVTVWWVKKRWRCVEPLCGRATFTEHTDQVPPYARLTVRLKERIVAALAGEVRCVQAVAAELGVSWPTAMRQLTGALAAQVARAAARPALVHSLGIDEHRFRSVRWYRDEKQVWRRVEPWMTTFTNLATGHVIGVVDGRDCAAVKTWLKTQPRWWRHRVAVVAIDPSAAFRSAVRTLLPKARVSVDHFHLVKLANDMVTQVRRRVSWDRHDRRGRATDLTWANRLLLMRGYDTLSERGQAKLRTVLATDDPTSEIGAAWGVKEQLRRLLACTSLDAAQRERHLQPLRHLGGDARVHPAEEHHRHLVASDRHIHPHQSDQRQDRSRERDHQEHQTHRPWIPLPRQLQVPHPALHRHPDGSVTTPVRPSRGNSETPQRPPRPHQPTHPRRPTSPRPSPGLQHRPPRLRRRRTRPHHPRTTRPTRSPRPPHPRRTSHRRRPHRRRTPPPPSPPNQRQLTSPTPSRAKYSMSSSSSS